MGLKVFENSLHSSQYLHSYNAVHTTLCKLVQWLQTASHILFLMVLYCISFHFLLSVHAHPCTGLPKSVQASEMLPHGAQKDPEGANGHTHFGRRPRMDQSNSRDFSSCNPAPPGTQFGRVHEKMGTWMIECLNLWKLDVWKCL